MAKSKSVATEPPPADFFQDMTLSKRLREAGVIARSPAEHLRSFRGLQIAPMALQYLIGGYSAIPYGQTAEIAGLPGSLKSSLAIELARHTLSMSGYVAYMDAELKAGPTFLPSLLGPWQDSDNFKLFSNLQTIQDWQALSSEMTERIRKRPDMWNRPVLIIVDSLTGRLSETDQEQFEKEGTGRERGFPVGAASITNFYKGFPALVLEADKSLPVIFVGINHFKTKTSDAGYVTGYTPGGSGKDFQATLRIVSRLESSTPTDLTHTTLNAARPDYMLDRQIELYGVGSRMTVELTCHKSCFGPSRRRIEVPYFYGYTADNVQYSWFDWHSSLVYLLATIKEKIGGRLLVTLVSNRASVSVDHKRQLDGVFPTEAGRWLVNDPEMLKLIKDFLHIYDCEP